jgi:hypothetical protein
VSLGVPLFLCTFHTSQAEASVSLEAGLITVDAMFTILGSFHEGKPIGKNAMFKICFSKASAIFHVVEI